MEITTVGLDLAKNVFQVHAITATGAVVVMALAAAGSGDAVLQQACPCLIGMEACGTSHH